jgi:hypothetical protein
MKTISRVGYPSYSLIAVKTTQLGIPEQPATSDRLKAVMYLSELSIILLDIELGFWYGCVRQQIYPCSPNATRL